MVIESLQPSREVALSLEELTVRQAEAVSYRAGNLLVEAVPGSGKTRVIVARCKSLLDEGVPASAILLLTFSRRAVGELRTRLSRALEQATLPDIRTFHGFAARLLADAGSAGRSRRLLSEPAERTLFAHIVSATKLKSLPAGIGQSVTFLDVAAPRVDEIRRASPEAIARLAERATPRVADLLRLERAQRDLRNQLGVADYDDLVARAVQFASTPGSAVANALRDRYAHVLVDEFQDTDPLQLALLAHFACANTFAVGDAAQAIYGFRGAARDALAHAKTTFSMATLPLAESFRCPENICDLAKSVWPSAPPLHSSGDVTGDIEIRCAASPQDEAAFIAHQIAAAISGGTPEREIAVLVRNADPMLRLVEDALHARGIVVARQGGENVLDDLAVDAICAALRAFAQPGETERWVRLLSHPAFGVAPLELRRALDKAPPRSIDDACDVALHIPAASRVPGAQFASALRAAHAYWDADEPVKAARRFATDANVLGFVIAGNERDAQRSSARIRSFLDGLADVHDIRTRLGTDTSAASVFAAFLTAGDAWRAGTDAIDDEPGVRVLTVHAAKGLEYRFVAIADAVDDRFPQAWRHDPLLTTEEIETARECGVDLGTRADEHIAEERSLWYVAVTRSKHTLLVTWSAAAMDGAPQRPSRFIPLDLRKHELRQPNFRSLLTYSPAILRAPQAASPASLTRPLATSAMETWFSCRRKFYYGALLRISSDERGFRAKLGTLVHRAIQAFHRELRDFRGVADGAHIAWSARLDDLARSVAASDGFSAFDSPLETDAAIRSANRLLDRYARELERSARAIEGGFEVVASEERVDFAVEGVAFSGKIDRIDRFADGSLALVDVKTSAFRKEKAMSAAFVKLNGEVSAGTLWTKAAPPGNPQLPLYRHAKPETRTLEYLYLEARPKADEFRNVAHADCLDVTDGAPALGAIDAALSTTFFIPWSTGDMTSLDPTRFARTCRSCEFEPVCPGFLEDDD